MAPPAARSPLSVRERPSDAEPTEGRNVDLPDDGVVITINPESGAVRAAYPDGSVVIYPNGMPKARKPRKDAGDDDFDENLADAVGEGVLASLSMRLLEGIDADIRSRADWEETAAKGAEYLGIKLEKAATEISAEGSVSKVHNGLLLESVARSWANARAELLPAGGPVKVRDDEPTDAEEGGDPNLGGGIAGPASSPPDNATAPGITGAQGPTPPLAAGQQPPGVMGKKRTRNQLADALEKDMNHYLTVVDREYYPDTSRMLFSRALLGCQFKKVYRCPLARRPVSRWVKGTDLIISNDASHLAGAGRVTERIPTRQAIVRRLQMSGHWRDVPLVKPTYRPSATDEAIAAVEGVKATQELPADHLHTIYECYTECDEGILEEDENGEVPGFPLPYRVAIDLDSRQVLEIRRNWKKGDEQYQARRRYVKFPFMPGLGFYDYGYIHLIGNPQRALTAMERLGIDAEMFASFPGGVIGKQASTKTQTVQFRVAPGEFAVVDTGGEPISDVVHEWPYKGMSPGLLPLAQWVEQNARRLAGTLDIPVGEGRVGNVPVGTMMAFIEAVSRVPSAIHKDDHIAQQEEFELLKELFVEEPQALWKFAKRPTRKWQIAEEIGDQELVPSADPNVPSQAHRVMQASALVQYCETPLGMATINPMWASEIVIRTLGFPITDQTWKPQDPNAGPPDLKGMAAMLKVQTDQQKNQIAAAKLGNEQQDTQREAAAQALEGEQREQDRASEERIEGMRMQTERMRLASEEQRAHRELGQEDQHHAQDMVHEHIQGHLDRTHEAQQSAADRTHEHTQGILGRQHEAGEADADRQQQVQQSAAEMGQADVHHQEDLAHEGEQNAAKLSTTERVAKQRGITAAKPKPKGKGKK
jgi:hypothetical protein